MFHFYLGIIPWRRILNRNNVPNWVEERDSSAITWSPRGLAESHIVSSNSKKLIKKNSFKVGLEPSDIISRSLYCGRNVCCFRVCVSFRRNGWWRKKKYKNWSKQTRRIWTEPRIKWACNTNEMSDFLAKICVKLFFFRSILSDALCAATAEWIFLLFFFCLPLVSYFCIFSSNLRCFSVVSLDERRGWMCMHSGKNNIYECTFFSRSLFVSYVSHVMRWLLERMHNETQNKTKTQHDSERREEGNAR